MFYEIRTYRLKNGTIPQYLKVVEEEGIAIQKAHLGNLVGYFFSEIGTINEIAKSCRSTYALVKKRLEWCRPVRVAVDVCSRCGNFSLASSGRCTDDACASQRNSKILINSV